MYIYLQDSALLQLYLEKKLVLQLNHHRFCSFPILQEKLQKLAIIKLQQQELCSNICTETSAMKIFLFYFWQASSCLMHLI